MCRCMCSVNVKVSKREIDEPSSNPGHVRYVRFRKGNSWEKYEDNFLPLASKYHGRIFSLALFGNQSRERITLNS